MATGQPFGFSQAETKRVKEVQFGILGPAELKSLSVVEVTNTDTFEHGRPKPKGLSDLRMGTIDRDWICETCHCENDCPGHFGHIELCRPVYHIGFLKNIVKVLRCVCIQCSRLLADEDDEKVVSAQRKRRPERRLAEVMAACQSVKACSEESGCGAEQPATIRRDELQFVFEFKSQGQVRRRLGQRTQASCGPPMLRPALARARARADSREAGCRRCAVPRDLLQDHGRPLPAHGSGPAVRPTRVDAGHGRARTPAARAARGLLRGWPQRG